MPDSARGIRDLFADVDVALLCGFSSQAPLAMFDGGGPLIPNSVQIVGLSDNAWELGKNQTLAAGILGDVKLNVGALLSALRATSQPRGALSAATRRKAVLAHKAEQRRQRWTEHVEQARKAPTLSATAIASELAEVMPKDFMFCDETLSNRLPFANLLGFESPLSYWSGKGGGLGFSMPGALGMRLAQPERTIVNGIGDGAFLYYPQTLWTAANLNLAVVFLVLNNSSYRVLKLGVQRMGGPWTASGAYPLGLDIDAPVVDIASMARSMGVSAERVERTAEMRPALERAFDSG
jgi:benzoylformate decarboxylase